LVVLRDDLGRACPHLLRARHSIRGGCCIRAALARDDAAHPHLPAALQYFHSHSRMVDVARLSERRHHPGVEFRPAQPAPPHGRSDTAGVECVPWTDVLLDRSVFGATSLARVAGHNCRDLRVTLGGCCLWIQRLWLRLSLFPLRNRSLSCRGSESSSLRVREFAWTDAASCFLGHRRHTHWH